MFALLLVIHFYLLAASFSFGLFLLRVGFAIYMVALGVFAFYTAHEFTFISTGFVALSSCAAC
jgi:hypothetical protein